jgi:hypothetical protein
VDWPVKPKRSVDVLVSHVELSDYIRFGTVISDPLEYIKIIWVMLLIVIDIHLLTLKGNIRYKTQNKDKQNKIQHDGHNYIQLFLYFNMCLSVMLNSISCSFTSISFLTTSYSFTLICVQV